MAQPDGEGPARRSPAGAARPDAPLTGAATLGDRSGSTVISRWRELCALVALCTIAIAQPIVSVLHLDPSIWLGRAPDPRALVAFVVVVVAVPPLVLFVLEVVVGAVSTRARRWLHLALVGVLTAGALVPVLVAQAGPIITASVALVGGVGVAALLARSLVVERWLGYMAPVAVLLVAHFIVVSPATMFLDGARVATAAPVDAADAGPPVMVVVLDELGTGQLLDEQGRIDAELFPNLARLAGTSTWYRNATTVAAATVPAMSALLTASYPDTGFERIGAPASFEGNLFALFGATHEVTAYEPLTVFCAYTETCVPVPDPSLVDQLGALVGIAGDVLGQSIDPRTETVSLPRFAALRETASPVEQFERFIDAVAPLDPDRPPPLEFLHVAYPHAPYVHLPSGRTYEADEVVLGSPSWQGPWPDDAVAWRARQRHLLQTQHADALVGRLLDRLAELGRLEETLLVVTADHGSAFRTGHWNRTLDGDNLAEILWVPLFIKAPGQTTGRISDRPVELVDVVPTVAALAGRSPWWPIDGVEAGARRDVSAARLVRWPGLTALGDNDDELLVVDRAAGFAELLATLPLGRAGADPRWRPHQRGPYADLVGRPVSAAVVLPDGPPGRLETPASIVVGANDSVVAARVSGWVAEATEVAVALEGTIVAVLGVDGDGGFEGILPDHVLTPGEHRLRWYVVQGPPAAPVLRAVSG